MDQTTKPLVGYGSDCPTCGEPCISRCRCFRADSTCKNRHGWHECEVHHILVIGQSDHAKSGCTCNVQLSATDQDRSSRESSSKVVDRLIDQGVAHGMLVSESVRDKIRKAITRDTPPLEILAIARRIIAESQPLFASTLQEALMASWLTGGQAVLNRLPGGSESVPPPSRVIMPGLEPGENVRFPIIEEAAKDLASRRVMSAADYYEAEKMVRNKAFTVSNVEGTAIIEDIQQYLTRDIETGGTLKAFTEFMESETPLSRLRIETIYRNAIGTGYERGQEAVANHPFVRSEFPYVSTNPIADSRLTELCRVIAKSGLDGTNVFRINDPVWQHFKPLRHHGCRCSSIFISLADAAAKGVKEAQRWLESGVEPSPPQFVPWPAVELPPGWTPGGQL